MGLAKDFFCYRESLDERGQQRLDEFIRAIATSRQTDASNTISHLVQGESISLEVSKDVLKHLVTLEQMPEIPKSLKQAMSDFRSGIVHSFDPILKQLVRRSYPELDK